MITLFKSEPQVWLYGLALVCGIGIGFALTSNYYGGEIASMEAEQAQAIALAQATARAQEQTLNARVQEAQNEASKQEQKLRTDLAAASRATGELRSTVAQLKRKLSEHPSSPSAEAAIAVSELLSECAGEYREVAERADRHAQDAAMMRAAWPK